MTATVPSGSDDVAETAIADEIIPTPLESGSVEAEQAASAAVDEVADDGTALVEGMTTTATDGDDAAVPPQSAAAVEAGEVQPTAGSVSVDDAPEIEPEQQKPVSVAETVVEGDAVAAAGSAAASSSSPDAVPGAVAEETSMDAVASTDVESTDQPGCAAGHDLADNDDTAVETPASAVGTDDPTAVSSEQEVCMCVCVLLVTSGRKVGLMRYI